MIKLPLQYFPRELALIGAEWVDIEAYYPGDRIRQIERASIRGFVEGHRERLRGRVLDFGCGAKPYRSLIEGDYVGLEKGEECGGMFDAILCTQVMQYLEDPGWHLQWFFNHMKPGAHLILTYSTNWDEVEPGDLSRFTKAGMERMLNRCGFHVFEHMRRAEVIIANFKFPLGYGVVCIRS